MKKSICLLLTFIMLFASTVCLSGCSLCSDIACDCTYKYFYGDRDKSIPLYVGITDDGFQYIRDNGEGVCLTKLPESEEVTIPIYINERLVTQLGGTHPGFYTGKTFYCDFSGVKKVNILHYFYTDKVINFENIETLVYIDYIYGRSINSTEKSIHALRPSNLITFGLNEEAVNTKVWLINGDNQGKNSDYTVDVILIPEFVTVIKKGVFDGLQGTIIKTSYESKPEGWEDGWNGDCEVQWGIDTDLPKLSSNR